MVKYIFVLCMALFTVCCAFGQSIPEEEPYKEKKGQGVSEKVYFGGNFGLYFGNDYSYVEVSPLVGYRITPRLSSGVGATYIYYHFGQQGISTHIYGGRVFSEYTFIHDLQNLLNIGFNGSFSLYTEFEVLSLEKKYFYVVNTTLSEEPGRYLQPAWWVGLNIGLPLGQRGRFNFGILWDLLNTRNSLYSSPHVRAGFQF
ncbi:MAG: hypothetical protein HC896_02480 [Bacteroidales bacterium]|nr:hypothetical protein [Bacteroidales bacterium]